MKKNIYKQIYKLQKKIRLVEEKIAINYKDYQMRCPTHLSIGQEAIAAASGLALNKNDISISYHRSHAHYLAKGGSLKNAVVVKDNNILNEGGLRNNKEFVNHKILDCIGDLYLSGYKIIGKIICSQGGHKLTNQLLREVFQNKDNFTIVEIKEKNIPHSLINRKYLRSIA